MSDINLRENPKPTDPDRDAVHVAVVKLIAGDNRLHPGSKFKLAHGSNKIALSASYNEGDFVGIANPYVTDNFRHIEKGTEFWGMLIPGLVNGMVHKWKCPIFDDRQESENEHSQWIREFCDRWNFDYNELIENSTSDIKEEYEAWIVARGIDLHSKGDLGEDHDLFWVHLEALTGKKFNKDHREKFGWSCSC